MENLFVVLFTVMIIIIFSSSSSSDYVRWFLGMLLCFCVSTTTIYVDIDNDASGGSGVHSVRQHLLRRIVSCKIKCISRYILLALQSLSPETHNLFRLIL